MSDSNDTTARLRPRRSGGASGLVPETRSLRSARSRSFGTLLSVCVLGGCEAEVLSHLVDAVRHYDAHETSAPDTPDSLDDDLAPQLDTLDTLDLLDRLDSGPALSDAATETATESDAENPDTSDSGDTTDGADTAGPALVSPAPARYLPGPLHSPINEVVRATIEEIATRGPDLTVDVFMKVGDSITVTPSYLDCFAGSSVDLAGRTTLVPTLEHFLAGDADGATPFDRKSLAAEGGRTARWAITGSPSPLDQEIAAIHPRFAIVMFGTNDMGWFGEDMARTLRWYAESYLQLVDGLAARGVVPVLMSIPPRTNDAFLARWVPTVNDLVRGVAQTRQLPFVDYHAALVPLPAQGLRADGVHPNAAPTGACDFTESGLRYGQNQRNLLSLEALDRVLSASQGEPPPDPGGQALTGEGRPEAPYLVDALPFFDARDTSREGSSRFDRYLGCGSGQDESGRELVYRLDLDREVRLRALVLDVGATDIDIHLLGADPDPSRCLARDDTMLQGTLGPGTYHLVADTFVSANGAVRSGAYLLVVTICAPDDGACDTRLDRP